jgi:PAS domain S-box-containing protein
VTVISADMTELNWAVKALRLTNRVLEESPELISVLGADYAFKYANRALAETFRLSADQITGMYLTDLTGRKTFENEAKVRLDRCLEGKEVRFESWFHVERLGQRYMNITLLPQRDEKGDVDSVAVFIRDLTEYRKTRDRLRQFEKMQAIGLLAVGIAHDFQNQLGAILACGEALRRRIADNDRLREYVDTIVSASTSAAEMTRRLLAFARKDPAKPSPVSIHGVIAEVISLLRHSFDEWITIREELCDESPTVMLDATRFQNALINIAVNARDAMPNGGELVFSTEVVMVDEVFCPSSTCEVTPGRYVRVCVEDTGIGMDGETRKRIFEPFFTTKQKGEGAGIGLATVHETVEQHHGYIEVHSEPGKGTTFKVYLPLVSLPLCRRRYETTG